MEIEDLGNRASYCLTLSSGQIVSYDELLSRFDLYECNVSVFKKHSGLYILKSKQGQSTFQDTIVIANENGAKNLLGKEGWARRLKANLNDSLSCKTQKAFLKIAQAKIPMDIQDKICALLKEKLDQSLQPSSDSHGRAITDNNKQK